MKITLFKKGLILLAIMIVAQLAYLALSFHIQQEYTNAQRLSANTKHVISEADEILAAVFDAEARVRRGILDRQFPEGDPTTARDISARLDALEALVSDNPSQAARIAGMRERAATMMKLLEEVERQLQAKKQVPAATWQTWNREALDRVKAMRTEFAEFRRAEERLDQFRTAQLERSRDQVNRLLIAGGGAALLLAAVLGYGFRREVSARFAALKESVNRFGVGKELGPPLRGSDEIADLDAAFRRMAADLTRATDRLRESARQLQDLYDNAPCGYHSVNPEGVVVAMNRTELKWLGYTAEQVVGRMRFGDMVGPSSRDTYREKFALLRETGVVTDVELEVVRPDGTLLPVLANSVALRDAAGNYLRSRTTLTDLTERKRAENEVRRMNEELEERVRHRTAELAEANRSLTERNEENELFVYSVSHDLRSPLVNLQGFSQELAATCRDLRAMLAEEGVPPAVRERATAALDRDADESLRFIQAGVMRLSGIIDALLRLSRAGRVEYQPRWVDVGAVVARVVHSLQGTAAAKGATIEAGPLPHAWGDPTAVEQVFANLIGNALNYLDPERPGRVEVGAVPPDEGTVGNAVTFFVRDNGRGIPEAYQHKVFQAFQRVHPDAAPGEGMGLAIVRRVVERHRGRLWLRSEPGAGSTFFVTFPVPLSAS